MKEFGKLTDSGKIWLWYAYFWSVKTSQRMYMAELPPSLTFLVNFTVFEANLSGNVQHITLISILITKFFMLFHLWVHLLVAYCLMYANEAIFFLMTWRSGEVTVVYFPVRFDSLVGLVLYFPRQLQGYENNKAGNTPGDFMPRSPRSAKIARCARCSDCDFRRSPRSAYKIADIMHVRYRRLNSPAFAKCARSRDFLRSSLQIASKVN